MSSTPKGITSEISPAHAHTLEIEDRKRRHENAIGRFVRFGGMQAVESAAHLVSMYRTNCISLGVQQQMLTSMHDLNDLSLLVEDKGSPVTLMLPRTLTALYERASARRYLDDDIQITKTFLCMAFLSQTAMTVPIVRSNAASIIQSILLDEAYPPGSFHLSFSGEPQVHYCDQFGTEIHGHEPWHGTRWRHLLKTVPVGGYILCISVHSDGVASGAQEKYPFSLTVENFSTLSRPGDRTQRVFGMGSHADIRKARGSSIPENLNPQQKVIKYTLQSRVAAEELADLEVLAASGAYFNIRSLDGSQRRLKLFIRVVFYKADMAEQQAITAVRTYDCTSCYGHQHAISNGKGRAGTDNRPHMDRSNGGFCATALKRTVKNIAKRQALCVMTARNQNFTAGDAQSSALGVRFLVQNSLSRLFNLIPHSAGGSYTIFGFDRLHGLHTGIFPKACFACDCLMLKFHAEAEEFRSNEDVRDEVDNRLIRLGPRYGHPSFKSGFWGSGDIGHTKGGEVAALIQLLPFVFAGCDLLIADSGIRVVILELLVTLARFGIELYTRQYYTDAEHVALDARIRRCLDLMHLVMDAILTGGGRVIHVPGFIFDIPKVHRFMGILRDLLLFGCLRNIDTEGGELSMKLLKKVDKLSPAETDATDSFLLARIASLDLDTSTTATLRQTISPGSRKAVISVYSMNRNVVGRGLSWMLVSKSLRDGSNGPIFTSADISTAIAFVIALTPSPSSLAEASVAVETDIYFYGEVSIPCVDPRVTYYIFRHGHCCQTTTGEYVQIILPVVSVQHGHFSTNTTGLGAEHESYSLVSFFKHVSEASQAYPELPGVPWLCRGALKLLPTNELVRRAQVVPLFGQAHRPTGDVRPHFLVNNLADPYYAGPSNRQVYRRCQETGCAGTLPKPVLSGTSVACGSCQKQQPWF